MRARLAQVLGGLRLRMAVLLLAGQLIVACGFYGLFDVLTRDWAHHEFMSNGRSTVDQMTRDTVTPLILGDQTGLHEVMDRLSDHRDVVGIAILTPQGQPVAARVNDPRLWTARPPGPVPLQRREPEVTRHLVAGVEVLSFLAAVVRQGAEIGPLFDDTREGLGLAGDRPTKAPPTELLGWVRLEYSTARVERDLATARQLSLALLVLALVLGLLASLALLRVVVRPLREARDLAREIAGGNLDRRLPVRSTDELGALATSMNTMAGALARSMARERAEASALRETAEAVVAIAQGARAAHDPGSVFRIVAARLRGVTRCDAVALAVPETPTQTLRFGFFDPEPPWGGLVHGAELPPTLSAALAGPDPPSLRLETALHENALTSVLAEHGVGVALLVPLTLEGGPPAALVLAARDSSAFTPSEVRVVMGLGSHLAAALHAAQLRDRLETAVEELDRTQEQLMRSERLRVAGELASGIAHEFNNVLGAILGRVQVLRRQGDRGALRPGELNEALGILELAARDGAETVRRLRQFGKSAAPEIAEPVDLDSALRDAVEFTRPRWKDEAESRGASIEMIVTSSPGAWVRGQASQLREVFTNLIMNAVDALPEGGTIRLHTSSEGGTVRASIEDDGVGITDEAQKRVLEPFFTTKAQGTGLGLSMVYGIVQRHGGELALHSQPGLGTRIELRFPHGQPAEAAALPPPAPEAAATGLSVLVVDDEDPVRELLMDILKMLGHQVVGCDRAEAALRDYEPGRFQLVLTDLGMPGMNGWQLSQKLREQDAAVTIVFVTGWGEELDAEQVRRAGADRVIGKPFGIDDLEGAVRLAAERAQSRAA
jgi:signal transduction histidine kinase/CheY-like chemotaxis protein